MRTVLIATAMTLLLGTAAVAKDFIVVSSSEPSVRTGQAIDGGARLPVGVGKSVTLIRPSGEVVVLQGGSGGVIAPAGRGEQSDASYKALRSLFAPPPSERTFGARRGFCPGSEVLDNIPAIARSAAAGCRSDARAAFQAYLTAHGVSKADAENLYKSTIVSEPDE